MTDFDRGEIVRYLGDARLCDVRYVMVGAEATDNGPIWTASRSVACLDGPQIVSGPEAVFESIGGTDPRELAITAASIGEEALELIARDGCRRAPAAHSITGDDPGDAHCRDLSSIRAGATGYTRDHPARELRWCDACIARDALDQMSELAQS